MKEGELKAVLIEIVRQMASPGGIAGLAKSWQEAMEQTIEGLDQKNSN